MSTPTTDESTLYAMSREQLEHHGREVEIFCAAAARDLATFTTEVLGLSPRSPLPEIMAAAAAAGAIPECREIISRVRASESIERAYSETLRRRGIRREPAGA